MCSPYSHTSLHRAVIISRLELVSGIRSIEVGLVQWHLMQNITMLRKGTK